MTIQISFEGRTAAVTGGASGLGLAITQRLLEAGATVIIMDRDEPRGAGTADVLNRRFGGKAHFIAVDVSDPESVAGAFDRIAGAGAADPLSILVNNAGIREIKGSLDLSPAEWRRVIDVDLSGGFYCAQQAALRMRATGGGAIVNIASVTGFVAVKKRPAYVTAKHGVTGLTKVLAADLAEHGIRVNAVAPGTFRSEMTAAYWEDADFLAGLADVVPMGAGGEPRDVADAVVFLASDLAKFVTGVTLPVDGGWLAEKTYSPRPSVYTRGLA